MAEEKEYIVNKKRLLAGKRGGDKDVSKGGIISLTDAQATPLLAKRSISPVQGGSKIAAPKTSDLMDAIGKMDPDDDTLWTSDGRPQVSALSAVAGRDVSATDRNVAWGEYQDALEKAGDKVE